MRETVEGKNTAARQQLNEALQLDPAYAMPHYNLAVLATIEGNSPAAQQHLARAQSLGYTGSNSDQLVQTAQAALAQVEGQGGA